MGKHFTPGIQVIDLFIILWLLLLCLRILHKVVKYLMNILYNSRSEFDLISHINKIVNNKLEIKLLTA